ncbi:MAG: ABC transporter ATP-binding protein [Eubacteriales bacterium]|nr:ABC transporter ATP-binding protein [Eubacteriales bacterium]MDD4683071.1 ABC transporter ATP-binding protein [Eubacteriales bacterium]
MTMIQASSLTLTYPSGKGVFDLDFDIKEGQVTGYLGPNGAGKTTTIRALMGFMKPDSGDCSIDGLDCYQQAPEIQRRLGYIPGEISFPDKMRGEEFLVFMDQMRGGSNGSSGARQRELLEMFELNPTGKINKFSKGMKQKLGIVAAFMHDPRFLILDEPTSGLDPLMQNRFVELIRSERNRGKTILMSSHSFEEVEKTCDDVLIIREGRIIHRSAADELKSSRLRRYRLRVSDPASARSRFAEAGFEVNGVNRENSSDAQQTYIEIAVPGDAVDKFIKLTADFEVFDLDLKSQTLEEVFMKFYSGTEISTNKKPAEAGAAEVSR